MVTTMKTLGDPIFARNPDGALKSRIGTLFFRTPGLVTQRGVHAMQRIAWVKELNRERAAEGRPALTEREAAAEWADSADLLFTDDCVLIRPDPDRMDLAFKADEVVQTLVSKRRIRFLNTHAAKVRDALRARGENPEIRTVHRLDKAVGGLTVLARTQKAAASLIDQISARTAEKEYLAVLRGVPEADAATLEDFLGWLEKFGEREGITFTVTVSADPADYGENVTKFLA